MVTTNFNDDAKKCMDACEQALEKKIKDVCGEMMEGLATAKEQKTVKTKELSIKAIKKDIANALLKDTRIIKMFSNPYIKKTEDCINRTISGVLHDGDEFRVDTYIDLDVMKNKGKYDVFINLKAHKDVLGNSITNCLDDISECIEEIVNELYPYHKCYSDIPEHIKNNFARRSIRFVLYPKDAERFYSENHTC